MAVAWGLRGKSALVLLLVSLIILIPAGLLGWKAVDSIHRHFAQGYSEHYTSLHMQRILSPVSRELALSRRMAESIITREWLADEQNPVKRQRFFTEAEGFRRNIADQAYFVVVNDSSHYYFRDAEQLNQQPLYRLDENNPDDDWYLHTVRSGVDYNININFDRALAETKVWFNVVVREADRVLGVMGAGLDLSDFLDAFIRDQAPGLTPMIVDRSGAIQAHPSAERIALLSGVAGGEAEVAEQQTIHSFLHDSGDKEALQKAMAFAQQHPGEIQGLWATFDGAQQLLSVGYIPELDWHVITALDLGVAQVFDRQWFWPLLLILVITLGFLLFTFVYATDRMVLTPLSRLKSSARAIADGDYRVSLPAFRNDEIGELSMAFSSMAQQIENHTQELESKVRERTRALEQANAEMAAANKKIGDSIQYAAIIQRAILPDSQLDAHLGHRYGLMWKPRDTVGGDFYIFRACNEGYLVGVVDCAGHGVPGALMTMLARAIIDNAVLKLGERDPAALLNEIDHQNREMLRADQLPASIATNMDIGLVWVDLSAEQLVFAGAKMNLYTSDGSTFEVIQGTRRALGHRRQAAYQNTSAPLRMNWTYYLCTDGVLDQAGGEHGFGFGESRFAALVKSHADRPMDQQFAAFETALREYQGGLPQRDDITVLAFNFPGTASNEG